MTEQPTGTGPDGIDQQLDAGIAGDANEGAENPEDARSGSTLHTDPDDPVEGMEAAAEASVEPSQE
jgi:hypothetical protein